MAKRQEIGIVISDKTLKTRRVEIPRLVKDPQYGKYIRRKTICYVHDENNESHAGDTVEIQESRPLSQNEALDAGAGRREGQAGRFDRAARRRPDATEGRRDPSDRLNRETISAGVNAAAERRTVIIFATNG